MDSRLQGFTAEMTEAKHRAQLLLLAWLPTGDAPNDDVSEAPSDPPSHGKRKKEDWQEWPHHDK